MKLRFAIAVAAVMTMVALRPAEAQGTIMTWNIDGTKRVATVFGPGPNIRGGLHPLVFVFHGHGGTMQTAAAGAHLQTLWPEAIVVYPQGLPTKTKIDPSGNFPGWQLIANDPNVDNRDLKFFDAMLATMRQTYSVDDQRIYATGFSNGAVFSYLLWAERGKILAAFGIVAGTIWPPTQLTLPRAVLVIGGETDQVLPFSLQQQAIEVDRQVDNATGPGQPCGPGCTLYPSTTQTPVVTRIHPGGHIYPPWAPGAIVEFFKLHKHP